MGSPYISFGTCHFSCIRLVGEAYKVSYGVFCSECNLNVDHFLVFFIRNVTLIFVSLKSSCDFFCFFSIICEHSRLSCLMLLACIFVVFMIS
jgi:hypothetical protein